MRISTAFFVAAAVLLLATEGVISAAAAASGLPVASGGAAAWRPPLAATWQWQLDTPVDQSVAAMLFDIDLFDNDAEVVAQLHSRNTRVVCYVNVGAWENWRTDAGDFPAQTIGKDYADWNGEKWLDIRRIDLLAPVMRARFDLCKEKGFDAIEPDNIDGFQNETGFPLTARDQLRYNRWLADEAHARGLSIGMKNDGDQVAQLLPYFDWALTEDCFAEGTCGQFAPFVASGKAVFSAEYVNSGITLRQLCPQARALKFNAILKRRSLSAWRRTCP